MRQLIRTLNRLNPLRLCLTPRPPWQRLMPLGLSLSLPSLVRGEDHVSYRYELYQEDHQRMEINTHAIDFEQKIIDSVIAKGELVYDGISGATPSGTHDSNGNVITKQMEDLRRAANLEVDWRLANHTLSPGLAWSKESDYLSYGLSLGDAIDFNDKNTTLQLGVSQHLDNVADATHKIWTSKSSTEGIIGVSQILSPKDTVDVAFTFGNDSGDLSDPYRVAQYQPDGFPAGIYLSVPERRPAHRNKEVLFASWNHYFESVDGSLELSYRFYHDSYDVFGHTLGVGWHQWLLNRHLMVEPLFRVYEQSSASFYANTFYGPFNTNPDGFHSSDYRLSEFYSLDYGLQATVIVCDHFHITAGYHRYEMRGLDNTSADMYPQANVVTVGCSILW